MQKIGHGKIYFLFFKTTLYEVKESSEPLNFNIFGSP